MSKKRVINNDASKYTADRAAQGRMQTLLDVILNEYKKAGIEPQDFREVVKGDDPSAFAREAYYNANRKFFPPGVDATTAINATAYSDKVVQDAWSEYKKLSKGGKPLKVTKDSVEITVSESDYDWYLADDKKEAYEALEAFIQAKEKLNEYMNVNPWGVLRAISGDGVLVRDGKLIPNPYQFKA